MTFYKFSSSLSLFSVPRCLCGEFFIMKIGLTLSHTSTPAAPAKLASMQRYIDALADAGAEAVPLWRPRLDDAQKIASRAGKLASQLDGVLVTGGKDLNPALYGQAVNPDAKVNLVNPLRTTFEGQLVRAMRERAKPILGICYGCQFFNVWRGGTLLQDIPLQHPNAIGHHESRHLVRLKSGSHLHRIIGQGEIEVASYHHQAIDKPGENTRITARSPDGIIEAIELDENPFWLGVQWHPEWDRNSLSTKKLFAAFIEACRQA